MSKNGAKGGRSVLANAALLVFCLIYLSPIYIIVVNSFKSRAEMYTNVLALPKPSPGSITRARCSAWISSTCSKTRSS